MKVAVSPTAPAVPALSQRLADYVELTKPRIAVMVLVTVAAGYLMAAGTDARLLPLLHTLIGTGLVAAGASAWNMWIERGTDARMRRTAPRAKLRVSPSFDFVGCVARWYVADVQMSFTSFLKS